jgi:hypothetical protein
LSVIHLCKMHMNKAAIGVGPFGFAVMVILLLFAAGDASAFTCVEITDSEQRLSCYDAAVLCQVNKSDEDRLACFDQSFDRAQSSSQAQPDSVVSNEVSQANKSRQTSVETVSPAEAKSVGEQIRSQKVSSKPTAHKFKAPKSNLLESKAPKSKAPEGDEDKFGLPDRGGSEDSNYVEATIVRVETNALRIDYLKLDNGQVWREVENGKLRFKAGQKVRIESGLLSSYKLKIVGKNLSVKVKRTQ